MANFYRIYLILLFIVLFEFLGNPVLTHSIDTSDSSNFLPNLNAQGLDVLRRSPCGELNLQKIAFNDATNISVYPWMALLEYNQEGNRFRCGGSLISNRYVLTGATCLEEAYQPIGVRLGEHDLRSENDCTTDKEPKCVPPHENFGIEKTIIHPNYQRGVLANDIALIKLDRDVDFKDHISPVCLPITRSADISPENFVVGSWDKKENQTYTSNVLTYGSIMNYNLTICTDRYKKYRIDETMLCTSTLGPLGPCVHNAGSPVFTLSSYLPENMRYIQYGIVSFGDSRCYSADKFPDVSTNVRHFMPWITSNIDG